METEGEQSSWELQKEVEFQKLLVSNANYWVNHWKGEAEMYKNDANGWKAQAELALQMLREAAANAEYEAKQAAKEHSKLKRKMLENTVIELEQIADVHKQSVQERSTRQCLTARESR